MTLINQMNNLVNNLEVYESEEFGQVRTIAVNEEPWFVANDIARALGYVNPSKATNDHCKKSKMIWGNDSLGRRQQFKVIPEGDIYRLIISSKLPSAEKFESWVFDEVLPSIRQNNFYSLQGLSKELRAIFTLDEKQKKADKKIAEVAEDLKDFKENAPLFNIECEELQKALRAKVISEMGGKKSAAYNDKSLRTKVFSDAQRQIKREFGLTSYKAIKRSQFNKALEIIENYKMPFVLREIIESANSQITMENLKLMKAKNELVKDYVV